MKKNLSLKHLKDFAVDLLNHTALFSYLFSPPDSFYFTHATFPMTADPTCVVSL